MKFIIVVLIMTSTALAAEADFRPDTASIYPEYLQVPSDSLFFDGYKAVTYNYEDSSGHLMSVVNVLRIFRDQRELIAVYDEFSGMYNFCEFLSYIKDNCYLQDINKDGLKELIVIYATGGASCCEGAGYLYSMSDSAMLLLQMKPTLASFEIADLEHDSIPEIITYDDTFTSFMEYPYRSFLQQLIWRWDGKKYRLANRKFADYILNQLGPNQIPPLDVLNSHTWLWVTASKSVEAPTDEFWNMVFSYYFAGKPVQADSLFNTYWPPGVQGKDDYYKELKRRTSSSDPLWRDIMESHW